MEDVFEKKFSGAGGGSAAGGSASTYGSAATGRGSARADGIGHSACFRLPASRPVTSPPRRFRTIQVCPRDLPARRWYAEGCGGPITRGEPSCQVYDGAISSSC